MSKTPALMSDSSMQYLKDATVEHLQCFCKNASDPELSGLLVDDAIVFAIHNTCECIQTENDPLKLLQIIHRVVTVYPMYSDIDGPEPTTEHLQRKRVMLNNLKTIYFLFCLGFTEICVRMECDMSILNQDTVTNPELMFTNKWLPADLCPRLSSWLEKSGSKWMEGMVEISDVYSKAHRLNMNDPFMYMLHHPSFVERSTHTPHNSHPPEDHQSSDSVMPGTKRPSHVFDTTHISACQDRFHNLTC